MPVFARSEPKPAERSPPERYFATGALVAAAALIGFGFILWIAANWDGFGKMQRFALIFAALAASAIASLAAPRALAAFALTGLLCIGGLLALIGQTYQTGADPWQLFALWAALALPWALAARHDAVWSAWVIVAFTAIGFWWRSGAQWDWVEPATEVLPVWLAAFAVFAAMSPLTRLEPWLGSTKWGYRIAGTLSALLVLSATVPSILDKRGSNALIAAGFAVTLPAIAALALTSPLDVALLCIFALSLDVLIIALAAYPLFFAAGHPEEIAAFLTIGVLAAVLVAATARAVLALHRQREQGAPARSAPASGPSETGEGAVHAHTWSVAVMTGIGALFAAVPILIFLGLAFGPLMERGPGPYLFGGGLLVAALFLFRGSSSLTFRQQFGVVTLIISLMLIGYGIYRDLAISAANALMLAVCTGLAFAVPRGWIDGILGAAAGMFLALISADLLHGVFGIGASASLIEVRTTWMIAAAVPAGLLLASTSAGLSPEHRERSTRFLAGALAATLAGLIYAAGPTFLLGSWWGPGGGGMVSSGMPGPWHIDAFGLISVLLAATGLCVLQAAYPRLPGLAGYAAAALALVLALVIPGFGATVLALAVAAKQERRALAFFAAFTGLWLVGAFYYWLGWPLTQKAYLMLALGFALAAAAWLSHAAPPHLATTGDENRVHRGFAAALVLISSLATSGLGVETIREKENILTNGRRMLLELTPVDPRSVMQGDYMALRFKIPDNLPAPDQGESDLRAIATIDERGIATVARRASKGEEPLASEAVIHVMGTGGGWRIGPNAFFFKEGEAEKFSKARYGEFRVDRNGDVLLIGLADEKLEPIK